MEKVSRKGRGAVVSIDVRTFAIGRGAIKTQSRRNQDAVKRFSVAIKRQFAHSRSPSAERSSRDHAWLAPPRRPP
jgi:hypothetical protein